MYGRILVLLDGDAAGERVLSWVRRVARGSGAVVHLLMTRRPSLPIRRAGRVVAFSDQLDESARAEALSHLTPIAEELRADGLTVETEVRLGEAGEAIVLAARTADLVVVGPEPPSRWGALRGDRASRLLALGGRPVLVAGGRSVRSA
jgi:nucleotide-binding universal stress UspA family protein